MNNRKQYKHWKLSRQKHKKNINEHTNKKKPQISEEKKLTKKTNCTTEYINLLNQKLKTVPPH